MFWLHKIKQNTFISYLLIAFGLLFALKWGAIFTSYSYLLVQMQWWRIAYFVLMVIQGDAFLIGILLALAYGATRLEKKWAKICIQTAVVFSLLLVFSDVMAMFVYQQRFSFSQMSGMIATANEVVWMYFAAFFVGIVGFVALTRFVGRFLKFSLTKYAVYILVGASAVFKLIPLPILQVSGGELPVENVFAQWFKEYYQLNLAEQSKQTQKSDFSSFLSGDTSHLDAKKWSRLSYAKLNPERLFADFPQKELIESRDPEGNYYVKEVLEAALRVRPELVFLNIDKFKEWKGVDQKPILKDLLEFSITQNPQLAYTYLETYEELVESNEKIAKSLLEKATELYENKLNFKDLFVQEKARNNKKNLILVFFESASVLDSKRFGGMYDRFPQTDKISQEGMIQTNMFANGVTSEMGHIATLMGVEPQFLGTSLKTGYERFTGVVEGLGTFFKNHGYATHFVSTASLDFLNQRSFLKKVGFDTLREDGYEKRKTYTFNAAPDEALYEKTLEVIKKQDSPYFLTLQTISSHTPYSSPYGNTANDSFRYMDESFAKFYQKLKKQKFFDDGILVVVGDHRKMTPMESQEYAKRGASAESRVMSFVIGSGIQAGVVDANTYQQTDLFYSLRKEFGSGEVATLQHFNDLFAQKERRNWAIKNFSIQSKASVFNASGASSSLDIPAKLFGIGSEGFDEKEIANYMYLGLKYQKGQNQEEMREKKSGNSGSNMVLIAHRGEHSETTENSMASFVRAARFGADAIEFDVTATKDGKLIVFHGPKLYNTTCAKNTKDICELTYEELKSCKLNNGEDIFLLENRLPKIKNLTSLFFLDLKISDNPKCSHLKPVKLLAQARQIVQENQLEENMIFSTGNPELGAILGQTSNILTSVDSLSEKDVDLLSSGNFLYFMAPYKVFTAKTMGKIAKTKNRYGQPIIPIAYTVNDLSTYRKLKKLGLRYIMTDALIDLHKEEYPEE